MRRYQFPYVPTPRGRPPMRWTDTQEPTTCRRSSGGNERVCACRDKVAVQMGLLMRCEGLTWDGRHEKPLLLRERPIAHALMCRSVRTGAPVSRWTS